MNSAANIPNGCWLLWVDMHFAKTLCLSTNGKATNNGFSTKRNWSSIGNDHFTNNAMLFWGRQCSLEHSERLRRVLRMLCRALLFMLLKQCLFLQNNNARAATWLTSCDMSDAILNGLLFKSNVDCYDLDRNVGVSVSREARPIKVPIFRGDIVSVSVVLRCINSSLNVCRSCQLMPVSIGA